MWTKRWGAYIFLAFLLWGTLGMTACGKLPKQENVDTPASTTELPGLQEDQESVKLLVPDGLFPYEQWYADGSPRLLLYYDPQSGEGHGVEYVRYGPDRDGTFVTYEEAFSFEETQIAIWRGYHTDYTRQELVLGWFGWDAGEEEYEEGVRYEYDDEGRVAHFEFIGDSGEREREQPTLLLRMDYEYDENGVLRHRSYFHNPFAFGSTSQTMDSYFDVEGRLEYEHSYVTHGSIDSYYIYEDNSDRPVFVLSIDGGWAQFTYYRDAEE